MSYMNSLIKVGVLVFNIFLFLCGLIVALISGLVYSGQWPEFERETYAEWCYWGMGIGFVVIFVTVLGCIGSANQVQREGCCPGRCVLGYYQILLVGSIVAFMFVGLFLKSTIDSIQFTLDKNGDTEYDKFEIDISSRFNSNYFAALCSEFPENTWFLDWSDTICPATMNYEEKCFIPRSKRDPLADRDVCEAFTACESEPFNPTFCCPDEQACSAETWGKAACPYEQCRTEALNWLVEKMEPVYDFFLAVGYISMAMMLLTCLLICYNPKDTVEKELIKTGVLVQHKVEQPKQRRQSVRKEDGQQHGQHHGQQRGQHHGQHGNHHQV